MYINNQIAEVSAPRDCSMKFPRNSCGRRRPDNDGLGLPRGKMQAELVIDSKDGTHGAIFLQPKRPEDTELSSSEIGVRLAEIIAAFADWKAETEAISRMDEEQYRETLRQLSEEAPEYALENLFDLSLGQEICGLDLEESGGEIVLSRVGKYRLLQRRINQSRSEELMCFAQAVNLLRHLGITEEVILSSGVRRKRNRVENLIEEWHEVLADIVSIVVHGRRLEEIFQARKDEVIKRKYRDIRSFFG